jgi:hypothetical protein
MVVANRGKERGPNLKLSGTWFLRRSYLVILDEEERTVDG